MNLSSFLHMTFVFFIVMDSIGTIPIFVGVLSPFEPKRQRQIIVREMLIALGIMLLFLFFGENFLKVLHIDTPALQISGGIIIFLIALKLLFAVPTEKKAAHSKKEPLIVPLAVPSIAGPGILAAISLWGGIEKDKTAVFFAVILAWLLSLPILLLASLFKKYLGPFGLIAVERLFGYLLALISIDMVINWFLASFKFSA